MAIPLPTSIQADWLVLRRASRLALIRSSASPALLVVGCAALACIKLYLGFDWPVLASAVVALAGSFALAHNVLMGALLRSRFGWCGALPVRTATTSWSLVVLTGVALMLMIATASLLLVVAARFAPHPDALDFALLTVDGGLVVGAAAAVLFVLRPRAVTRAHHKEGIRESLLALPWLNDSRLPHLVDWQRRAVLVRWRRGGSFFLVGCALASVPHGAAIPPVFGLVLLAGSWAWLVVAMRACADVTVAAARLLGPQPDAANRMRVASLRYPSIAAVCALILAMAGPLLGGGFAVGVIWILCAIGGSLSPIIRIIKTTNPGRVT